MATMGNPTQTLILGVDIARFEDGLKRLRTVYLAVIPAGLLLVGFGAWFVAGRTLRPLNAVTASVDNVTAKGLDQRIDIGAHDREFSRLISVLNEMLNRLQTSFQQATRFSADASHELKTPLAIMQGEIEQALRQAEDGSEIQRTFGRQLEEIQRLKIITRKLLLLSRADSGELVVSFERINLSEMIAATAEDADILASHLDVEAEIEPDILVDADPVLIQQVLQNLAANAANFRISNSGPGIAPEQRERVFDRFHRADTARNRDTDGVGLGLSLCREIVRAHDGELRLVDSSSETAVFELSLCLRRCRKKDAGDATSRSPQAAT
jgi:two-component system heavy metal sensor histidine kinase CusS